MRQPGAITAERLGFAFEHFDAPLTISLHADRVFE
jgi:hypothetical protein